MQWFFILAATGLGGALVLWHTVSRTKHASELFLNAYAELLAKARERKAEEKQKTAEQAKPNAKASSK